MKRPSLMGMRLLAAVVFVFAIITVCSAVALAAEVKVGVVNATSLNLRSSHSIDSKTLQRVDNGAKVVVLEESDGWCSVIYKQTRGYMYKDYLVFSSSADFTIGTGVVNATSVNFRKSPSLNSGIIKRFDKKDKVSVIGIENGWYKVSVGDKTGYVHPDYIDIAEPSATTSNKTAVAGAVATKTSPEGSKETASETANSSDKDGIRADIIAYAKTFLGCSYRYGTMSGKTFDCSGFTSYVYKKFGYSLNRSASGQVSNGAKVASRDQLRLGDIVLFRDPSINKGAASHVGLYVGDGKFIHCSSRGGGVKYNSLNDSYYNRYYVGARRIVQ